MELVGHGIDEATDEAAREREVRSAGAALTGDPVDDGRDAAVGPDDR